METPSHMFLAIDLGNSRCKGCLVAPTGGATALFDLACDAEVVEQLHGHLRAMIERATPIAGALASVADERLEGAIVAVVEEIGGLRLPVNPDSGLELLIDSPETVGPDRLYAARGALERLAADGSGRPAIVVDAGTALTVDAVLPGGRGSGSFLGGAIAPGPRLLARSLVGGAARLPAVEPRPGRHALGRRTEEAIEAGVCVGFEGAALRLVERIAEEAGLPDAPIVLTGGAREYLTEVLVLPGHELVVEPHLVHLGLAAACAGTTR